MLCCKPLLSCFGNRKVVVATSIPRLLLWIETRPWANEGPADVRDQNSFRLRFACYHIIGKAFLFGCLLVSPRGWIVSRKRTLSMLSTIQGGPQEAAVPTVVYRHGSRSTFFCARCFNCFLACLVFYRGAACSLHPPDVQTRHIDLVVDPSLIILLMLVVHSCRCATI